MTILNTVQVVGDLKADSAATGLCLVFGAIVFLIITVCAVDKSLAASIISFVLTAVCFVSAMYILGADSTHETYTKYECTIDDTYPVNELLEKYDVVEQRGEIYVLRDKKQ